MKSCIKVSLFSVREVFKFAGSAKFVHLNIPGLQIVYVLLGHIMEANIRKGTLLETLLVANYVCGLNISVCNEVQRAEISGAYKNQCTDYLFASKNHTRSEVEQICLIRMACSCVH